MSKSFLGFRVVADAATKPDDFADGSTMKRTLDWGLGNGVLRQD